MVVTIVVSVVKLDSDDRIVVISVAEIRRGLERESINAGLDRLPDEITYAPVGIGNSGSDLFPSPSVSTLEANRHTCGGFSSGSIEDVCRNRALHFSRIIMIAPAGGIAL